MNLEVEKVRSVLLVWSSSPVGPVGLCWSRRLGRPGGLGTISRRPGASQELVRGSPESLKQTHFSPLGGPGAPGSTETKFLEHRDKAFCAKKAKS